MSRGRHFTDWTGLTRLIEKSLKGLPGFGKEPRVEGRLKAIHEGIGHDNFFFAVGGCGYILRTPKNSRPLHTPAEARELLAREVETLRRLEVSQFPFPTPKLVCPVTDDHGATVGLIESCMDGISLSQLHNGVNGRSRLELIAEVAARVQALPASDFRHLPPCPDAENHVRAALDALPAQIDEWPVVAMARDWITAHITNRPSAVLHGDLLPQNLLFYAAQLGALLRRSESTA